MKIPSQFDVLYPACGWLAFSASGFMIATGTNSPGPLAWAGIAGLVGWGAGALLIRSDQATAQPARAFSQQATKVNLVVQDNAGMGEGLYLDLPVEPNALVECAKVITSTGFTFSHAALSGAGRPLTRPQYESLRTELERRDLLTLRNPRSPQRGYVLTARGRLLFKSLTADSPVTPDFAAKVWRSLGKNQHS